MGSERHEYMLLVWDTEPKNKQDPFNETNWTGHVTNAREMPGIGEKVYSEGFWNSSRYQVFDVRHPVGMFSELTLQSASETTKATLPETEEGLPRVLAYRI